jgi:hypothetical protein
MLHNEGDWLVESEFINDASSAAWIIKALNFRTAMNDKLKSVQIDELNI